MSIGWEEVGRAWESWTAGLAFALGTLAHGDALFIYPEPAEPTAWPLLGPSVRILRWGGGPPIVIGRLPAGQDSDDEEPERFSFAVRSGSEHSAAEVIARRMQYDFGCIHPSFVRFGGAEIGADADIWVRTLRTRLTIESLEIEAKRRPRMPYQRYAGDQPSLFSPVDLDPTSPTLWD